MYLFGQRILIKVESIPLTRQLLAECYKLTRNLVEGNRRWLKERRKRKLEEERTSC